MSKQLTATARATVTIELAGLGSWGEECTVQQILDQATAAALSRLSKLQVRLVGNPRITIVTITEEEHDNG